MSVDSCQRDVQRHQQEIAKLHLQKSREATRAVAEIKRASDAAAAAAKTKSVSTRTARSRDAERYQAAAAQGQEDHQRSRKAHQVDREREARIRAITGTLTQHDQLHRVAMSAIEKIQQLPEEITVLFFAANPLDQGRLRLEEEVRSIQEEIRKSEHRNAVRLESRWAVRPLDVLQQINEAQPRIIHFSGHGSDQDELVFQDAEGNSKLVSKEAIVQTMAAGSHEIQLVFFNTCYSREQAEAVVKHVPVAIGMNTTISDKAARTFSAKFYSAIGFELSGVRAFEQGKAALMLEGIPEDSTPELFVTPGLDADQLVLVQPD
jgi:hypothetical protein